ncbi:MAG: hypothetical protein HQL72_05965 [Magnetococcales bacterium]|nr:hypothetical protein [Magnetococcales bacterium]
MMTLETTVKIRRDHKIHGKKIKEISRERGLSKNTVRKAIREGVEAFTYKRKVQPRPQLGPAAFMSKPLLL